MDKELNDIEPALQPKVPVERYAMEDPYFVISHLCTLLMNRRDAARAWKASRPENRGEIEVAIGFINEQMGKFLGIHGRQEIEQEIRSPQFFPNARLGVPGALYNIDRAKSEREGR